MSESPSPTGRLLSANDAVKALNARGLVVRPVDVGDGREFFHARSGRTFVEWSVPDVDVPTASRRRWYILVDPLGNRENYIEDYAKAVRHFELLTRPKPAPHGPRTPGTLVEATLTFYVGEERLGVHTLYFETDLGFAEIEAQRHEIAELSPVDDDRIPDRHFEIELAEMDELPPDETLTAYPGATLPSP